MHSAMLSSFVVGVARRSGQEATNAPMANRRIWRGTRLGRNHGIVDGCVVYGPTRNHASPDGRRWPTMFAMAMPWALLFSLRCVSGVSKNNFQSPRLHSCMQPGGLQQGKAAITGRSQGGEPKAWGSYGYGQARAGAPLPPFPCTLGFQRQVFCPCAYRLVSTHLIIRALAARPVVSLADAHARPLLPHRLSSLARCFTPSPLRPSGPTLNARLLPFQAAVMELMGAANHHARRCLLSFSPLFAALTSIPPPHPLPPTPHHR